ncbi:MAG: Gfo/Idh/MocA family oxidoreductase [Candidatus Hydrogenedentes bacterium]|nr:Gfo/Idh/MocA family oxidoreductase [Candidatus Hydrogenedentota bacterium]
MVAQDTDLLGIGIIGAGFMGQTYARTIDTLVTGAELRAVAVGSRAATLAEEYSIAHEDSMESLLSRDDVHIICIATPHALHGEQGLAAAKAGKHLLIDKPMACTTAECDAILAVCKERQLRCDITYTQRDRICNTEMKRLIDEGTLGKVRHIHNVQVVPDGMKTTPAWQLEKENVGILMGHGIHNIDQVRWLTGQEVTKVFAKVRAFDSDYAVDSTADLILTLEDGTVCTIFCSFEVPAPGIPRTGGATQVTLEKGGIDSDWYGELRVAEQGGEWKILAEQEKIDWGGKGFLDPVRLKTYAKALQRLVDGIRNGDSNGTGWDGRQAVAIAEAAYESSRTGQEVAL